jgi:hypothetical protein
MDEVYQHVPAHRPMEYLKSINRVLIYLKALTLSDLCYDDGMTINQNKIVLGTTVLLLHELQRLSLPRIPSPDCPGLADMETFIFNNFLNGNLTLSRGRIALSAVSHPLQCPLSSLQSVTENVLFKVSRKMKGVLPTSLPGLMAVLLKKYVKFLGQLTLPTNLQLLYNSLCDGDLIAASDGSVRDVDNMGSYGYVLSHKVRNDVHLQGCQKIIGNDSLCSLTTEQRGVLCVVLILYMMSL